MFHKMSKNVIDDNFVLFKYNRQVHGLMINRKHNAILDIS